LVSGFDAIAAASGDTAAATPRAVAAGAGAEGGGAVRDPAGPKVAAAAKAVDRAGTPDERRRSEAEPILGVPAPSETGQD
jgi:hypothetical protein